MKLSWSLPAIDKFRTIGRKGFVW